MTRDDVYQQVTDRIAAALEEGTVAWRKPWATGGPVQLRTGRPYRGVNVFLLELEAALAGHADPRWGTFKAIADAGGRVRKGEKGTRVILWKPVKRRDEDDGGEAEERSYLLLRAYTVFNAGQADGLPPLPASAREHEPHAEAEAALAGYRDRGGPPVAHGGPDAYYHPVDDRVQLPVPEAFWTPADYYAASFHEHAHSTGAESRLARFKAGDGSFGDEPYAREELVAEMAAAMLVGVLGLERSPEETSAAYIAGWLEALRGDRRLVVVAAAQAQKAADLILGVSPAAAARELAGAAS